MLKRTILVTRPQPDAQRTAAGLAALGLDPIIVPMLEARFLKPALPSADGFAALVVTSANAIRALAAHPDGERFAHLPVYAVGDQTAVEARNAGFAAVTASEGTLHHLAETVIAARPTGPIFYAAPHHQSGDLSGLLAPHGIDVETIILYEMQAATALPVPLATRLRQGDIDGAVFYSRRTAKTFAALLDNPDFDPVRRKLSCLCLSENIAEPLIENHFVRIGLADYPSNAAMMVLALAFARDQISS
ncbi:uroporphyrinogen-III synthase [Pelagibacterium luteolum]|uniref:Uroporphyrinogen-III synthase n=1 Tax=Pelagibacterium luteolum TaxID=440168 RepID=A0A1G7SCM7_9HYPH|nr:uroporphyrinogen-III synthase [Pelagibacterium luteolum]SDG20786.1 uroporphyrinogen-III synthase [Pelagibacterium luteolum]